MLTLHIQLDSQVLNKLKGLPSSGEDKTFAIDAKEDLVCFSCEACWLISFDLYNEMGEEDYSSGCSLAARLAFGFKYSDEDELRHLVQQKKALEDT